MKVLALSEDDPCGSAEGFTLLEVLIALVILGLSIAFLTTTISDSLARVERVDAEDKAATLADTILARVGRDIPMSISVVTGQDRNLSWRLVVTKYSGLNSSVPVDQLDLSIGDVSNRVIGRWQTLRLAVPITPQ